MSLSNHNHLDTAGLRQAQAKRLATEILAVSIWKWNYASFAHGYYRATTDIDLLVPATLESGKRIKGADDLARSGGQRARSCVVVVVSHLNPPDNTHRQERLKLSLATVPLMNEVSTTDYFPPLPPHVSHLVEGRWRSK